MAKNTPKILVPTESEEQAALFQWAALMEKHRPELRKLFHIPNGGHRSKATAARLAAEGVRSGVPDICLPVARQGYHGLYIELKRREGGRVEAAQADWIHFLREHGYKAEICKGFTEAKSCIEGYLEL